MYNIPPQVLKIIWYCKPYEELKKRPTLHIFDLEYYLFPDTLEKFKKIDETTVVYIMVKYVSNFFTAYKDNSRSVTYIYTEAEGITVTGE